MLSRPVLEAPPFFQRNAPQIIYRERATNARGQG